MCYRLCVMMGGQRAWPLAVPLPSLVTQTNTGMTSLPHRHWTCFLLFIFFLNILLLFLAQTPVVPLWVCPQSHHSSSSSAFCQSLVLLLQRLQGTPGRNKDKVVRFKPLKATSTVQQTHLMQSKHKCAPHLSHGGVSIPLQL